MRQGGFQTWRGVRKTQDGRGGTGEVNLLGNRQQNNAVHIYGKDITRINDFFNAFFYT